MYNAVTPAIVEALGQITGPGNILLDEEALEPYSHDETVGLRAVPDVVVKVDPTQVRQLVINLVLNAAEASQEGGRIHVRARGVAADEVDATGAVIAPDELAEHYALLEVEDEGCGMSPAERERVFEPFYTGRTGGTGLGLSVCYGIVERHGGHIEVESQPGLGSTFRVCLNRSPQSD